MSQWHRLPGVLYRRVLDHQPMTRASVLHSLLTFTPIVACGVYSGLDRDGKKDDNSRDNKAVNNDVEDGVRRNEGCGADHSVNTANNGLSSPVFSNNIRPTNGGFTQPVHGDISNIIIPEQQFYNNYWHDSQHCSVINRLKDVIARSDQICERIITSEVKTKTTDDNNDNILSPSFTGPSPFSTASSKSSPILPTCSTRPGPDQNVPENVGRIPTRSAESLQTSSKPFQSSNYCQVKYPESGNTRYYYDGSKTESPEHAAQRTSPPNMQTTEAASTTPSARARSAANELENIAESTTTTSRRASNQAVSHTNGIEDRVTMTGNGSSSIPTTTSATSTTTTTTTTSTHCGNLTSTDYLHSVGGYPDTKTASHKNLASMSSMSPLCIIKPHLRDETINSNSYSKCKNYRSKLVEELGDSITKNVPYSSNDTSIQTNGNHNTYNPTQSSEIAQNESCTTSEFETKVMACNSDEKNRLSRQQVFIKSENSQISRNTAHQEATANTMKLSGITNHCVKDEKRVVLPTQTHSLLIQPELLSS